MAESLLKNLLIFRSKFDLNSVHQYHKKLERKDDFNLTLTTEKKVLEILQCIKISKAAGLMKFRGYFYGVHILAKPV